MIVRPTSLLAAALLVATAVSPRCALRSSDTAADSAHPPAEETMTSTGMVAMEGSAEAAAAPIVPVVSDDPFVATVRPVLSVRCAPCHNPGGKMYGRLPFDDAKTVASNSEGILRRLKGDDRAALEKWVAQIKGTGSFSGNGETKK